jgi:nucleoid-associated protein YgaU
MLRLLAYGLGPRAFAPAPVAGAEADDGRPSIGVADTMTISGGSAARPSLADQFIANARRFLGQPYLYAGGHSGPMRAPGPVDCSGLVTQAAYMTHLDGIAGSAAMLQGKVTPVAMNALQPGDLLFHGHPASHVGIYIGNGMAIHSPHTGAHVSIVNVAEYGYFDNAGRIPQLARSPGRPRPPATHHHPQAPRAAHTYTVRAGDTLAAIAARYLGAADAWPRLYAANRDRIANPSLIYPGQVLRVPWSRSSNRP